MEGDATGSRMFVHTSRQTASSKTYKLMISRCVCPKLISVLCEGVECSHLRCAAVALTQGSCSIHAIAVTDLVCLATLLYGVMDEAFTRVHSYCSHPSAPLLRPAVGAILHRRLQHCRTCTIGPDHTSAPHYKSSLSANDWSGHIFPLRSLLQVMKIAFDKYLQ